jgi:hypothetical protein
MFDIQNFSLFYTNEIKSKIMWVIQDGKSFLNRIFEFK